MARRTKPTIDDELIDKLLEGREHGAGLLGNDGLIGELKKRLAERVLAAELDVHLDAEEQKTAGNHRNGYTSKTVTMAEDRVVLDIPRDRHGQFDPALIPKYARRFPGFDEKVIALHARGMSTRDIQAHIEELYGVQISANLVSAVTEAVMDEALAWQSRPLDPRAPAHARRGLRHRRLRLRGDVQSPVPCAAHRRRAGAGVGR